MACHFGDSEQEVHDSLRISSSAVFNGVLMFVLKEVSSQHALPNGIGTRPVLLMVG